MADALRRDDTAAVFLSGVLLVVVVIVAPAATLPSVAADGLTGVCVRRFWLFADVVFSVVLRRCTVVLF